MSGKEENNFDAWKVEELRQELRNRDLDDRGTKQNLINRLTKSQELIDMVANTEEPEERGEQEDEPQQKDGTSSQTGGNVTLADLMSIILANSEQIAKKLEANSEEMTRKLEANSEEMKKQNRQNSEEITRKLNEITEKLDKKVENQEKKIKVIEEKQEFLNKQVQNIDKRTSENNLKLNSRISEMEDNVKRGIQINLDIAEQENRKTERQLRKEIEEKLNTNINVGNSEEIKKLKEELENKIKQVNQNISELSDNRVTPDLGFQILNIGGKFEESSKFCGDYRKIHPINYLHSIKNKYYKIKNLQDFKEFIRSSLTGNALLWWNCKEMFVDSFETFEKVFLDTFWSELQQSKVRERLYFGKFDNTKNNLSNYVLQLYATCQYLTPPIPEAEIVMFLSRHFKPEISEIIAVQNINKFDHLITYLQRIERNLSNSINNQNRDNVRNFNNNDISFNRQSNNNNFNRQNNNNNFNNNYNNQNRNQNNENRNNYNNNRNYNNNQNTRNFNNNYNNRNFNRFEQNNNNRANTNNNNRQVNAINTSNSNEGINETNNTPRDIARSGSRTPRARSPVDDAQTTNFQ